MTAQQSAELAICLPVKNTVDIQWAIFLSKVATSTSSYVRYQWLWNKHYRIDFARNSLVEESLRLGVKKILFIDSDIFVYRYDAQAKKFTMFPEFIINMMLMDYPIVTGIYWLKVGMSNVLTFTGNHEHPLAYMSGKFEDFVNKSMYVDAAGLGMMLIDVEVFRRVPYPWFEYTRTGGFGENHIEISEDVNFCIKAAKAGFKILASGNFWGWHEGMTFHIWKDWMEEKLIV